MSNPGGRTFRAVLLRHDGGSPRTLLVPAGVDVPPSRIRVPAEFVGASAFEVFELADDRGWPLEATYQLGSTIPRSTEDLPDGSEPAWDGEDDEDDV